MADEGPATQALATALVGEICAAALHERSTTADRPSPLDLRSSLRRLDATKYVQRSSISQSSVHLTLCPAVFLAGIFFASLASYHEVCPVSCYPVPSFFSL